MAGKGGGQNEGGSQIEMVWLIMLVLIVLGAWALWTYAKPAIIYPAFAIDYAIIWLIEHTKGIGPNGQKVKDYIAMFFDGRVHASDAKQITWQTFAYVRTVVGGQINWILSALIVVTALYVRVNMKGDGFKRTFSLAGGKGKGAGPSFAQYQAEVWKVATYSMQFDPDGRDKDIEPPMTPPEWMRKHGIKFEDGQLDAEACRNAFIEQLGKPWHGFERASEHGKVVLILCALHYLKKTMPLPEDKKKKKSLSLHERETLSVAWAGGKDGSAAMKALVEKYKDDKDILKVVKAIGNKHAYENTVVYAMLDRARANTGVLKEHDMAYIKKIDRNMWYGMNNCGRKRFHTEGSGIMSHYFAERVMNRALVEPNLDGAIDGIENYMWEEGIESLDAFFAKDAQEFIY